MPYVEVRYRERSVGLVSDVFVDGALVGIVECYESALGAWSWSAIPATNQSELAFDLGSEDDAVAALVDPLIRPPKPSQT